VSSTNRDRFMTESRPGRLASIDALRGFDMFWIVGGTWFFGELAKWIDPERLAWIEYQFSHSDWNGCRFYDVIFPLFLFIVGASTPFALAARRAKGATAKELQLHCLRRAATLFVLGLLYNNFLNFDFENMRWAGVLQRIGLCYLFATTIAIHTNVRGQALWTGGILIGYWALMSLVPVPGFGAGNLTPGGNLSGYLDRLFLPGRFCCYEHGDNEGILTTLPAVASSLMGVLAGAWLKREGKGNRKTIGLLGAGALALAAGWVWGLVFPINKILWSSSYVLFAGGWSLLLLAFFYYTIDVAGFRKWAFFFIVIGMNAITIYVGRAFIDFDFTAEKLTAGLMEMAGSFAPVLESFSVVALRWLFLCFLFRKGIFLKA
jgi:predicted acyltransferase